MALECGLFAALLYAGAGTVRWPAAWAFLAIMFAGAWLITRDLARSNPDLLAERMKPLVQPGQPRWDQLLMSAFVVAFAAWLVLMGLDAARFRWSAVPLPLQIAGAFGLAFSLVASARVFRENTFLATVVRIQDERGHHVVTTGPYAVIRHPLYAAAMLFFVSTALLLGSWWGLAATLVLDAGLVARTALEDAKLRHELDGYAAYARRVRYRLIPYVW